MEFLASFAIVLGVGLLAGFMLGHRQEQDASPY